MRKNILNSTLLLAAIGCLAMACKTKKALVKPPERPVAAVDTRSAEVLRRLRERDFSYRTLSLKAKAYLDINGNGNNVAMNIRMQKDEKIWVSITAIAGIEVARALITPDSIKVRNNFQQVYLKKPFAYIQKFASPEVDFMLLQSMLTGNTVAAFTDQKTIPDTLNGNWVLKGVQGGLGYQVLFNTLLKTSDLNLNDVKSGKALKVQYGEYQLVNELLFPSSAKISSVSGKQTVKIDLDFSKVERDLQLEYPFSVPAKFEVIN